MSGTSSQKMVCVIQGRPPASHKTCHGPTGLPFHSATSPRSGRDRDHGGRLRTEKQVLPRAALALGGPAAQVSKAQPLPVPENPWVGSTGLGLGSAKLCHHQKENSGAIPVATITSLPMVSSVTWGSVLLVGRDPNPRGASCGAFKTSRLELSKAASRQRAYVTAFSARGAGRDDSRGPASAPPLPARPRARERAAARPL